MNIETQQILNRLGHKRLGMVLLILCVILASWSSFVDEKAVEYIDDAAVKAMGAYGGARLLNGIVSMLQEIEVGVVAITAQPFQFLDSVNDLVEDYATVMKVAIGSLIVQKVIVEITSTALFKWLVSFFGISLMASLFLNKNRISEFVFRCFVFVGLVRFVFIFSIILNGVISQAFIADKIDEDAAKVNQLSSLAKSMESSLPEDRRAEIQLKMEEVKEEDEFLDKEITVIKDEIGKTNKHIEEAAAIVQEIKDEMGALDKINVFSDNPEYNKAKSDLEVLNKEHHARTAHLEELQEKRETIKLDIERLQEELEGGESGFINNLKSKMASVAVIDKIDIWKEKLNSIVPETLNLMALFFFETLIIPLVTLFFLLKGFKAIWGVDMHVLAKREIINIKKQ